MISNENGEKYNTLVYTVTILQRLSLFNSNIENAIIKYLVSI